MDISSHTPSSCKDVHRTTNRPSLSTRPQHRRLSRCDSRAYGEDREQPWSPWSRWRVVLKLLYAVIVPAIIMYLLGRFDRSLQGQDRGPHAWPQGDKSSPRKTLWNSLLPKRPLPFHQQPEQPPWRQTSGSAMIQQTGYDTFLLFGDSITQVSVGPPWARVATGLLT